jgi:hypothetical protein
MPRKSLSRNCIRSTSLYMGPLQWALSDYYTDTTGKNLSDAIRSIMTMYAEHDANFSPELFWEAGILAAYDRFADDTTMRSRIVIDGLHWLSRTYGWSPPPEKVPEIDDESKRRARALGLLPTLVPPSEPRSALESA